FLYAPDFFLWRPGWLMLALGLVVTTVLSRGPLHVLGVGLDLHSMLLGLTLTTLGYSAIQFATIARVFYDFDPERSRRLARAFTYDRGMIVSGLLVAAGCASNGILLFRWLAQGLRLSHVSYAGLYGLMMIILGFQTFV